jgi:hypothetical protein
MECLEQAWSRAARWSSSLSWQVLTVELELSSAVRSFLAS